MKKAEASMTGPQVIDDEPHERIYDRVAGIDVGKREATVCTRHRRGHRPHRRLPGAGPAPAELADVGGPLKQANLMRCGWPG